MSIKEMSSRKRKSSFFISSVIIISTAMVISLLVFMKMSPVNSLVTANNIARTDIFAPFDFYDEQGTIQRALMAYENQKPEVIRINDAVFSSFENVIDFFKTSDSKREDMKKQYTSQANTIEYRNNILYSYLSYCMGKGIDMTEDEGKLILLGLGDTEYENFKTSIKLEFANVQTADVFSANRPVMIQKFKDEISIRLMNQELHDISYKIGDAYLRINSIVNQSLTERARKQAYDNVIHNSPVTIIKGTRIASRNDVLDDDQIRLLYDMGILRTGSFNLYSYFSLLFILLVLTGIILAYNRISGIGFKHDKKRLLITGIVLIIVFLIAYFIPKEYYLVMPAFIITMMIAILLDDKIAVAMGIASSFYLTIMFSGDLTYALMLVVGGVISIYIVRNTNIRLRLALSGLIVGGVNVLILVCMTLLFGRDGLYDLFSKAIAVLIGCISSSIITIGLLPVFEGLFNIITPFKLLELSNPNQPLIKKLLLEAPGTYHHSLMVGNLAEAGAEAIGANGLLARVGAYYHDIGKLSRPGFFAENQNLNENPHNKMTPSLSTFVIINHTKDGIELARQYKLPHPIREIIEEHHGNTQVKYFYEKAKQAAGDKPIKEEEFRYPGPKPKTKESAVVLMADAVEASIRSLGSSSRGEVEGLIRKIIKEKIDDDQFSLCDLTFKDFDDIADAFAKVATGYFHQRIQYPEAKGVKSINEPDN